MEYEFICFSDSIIILLLGRAGKALTILWVTEFILKGTKLISYYNLKKHAKTQEKCLLNWKFK